MADKKKNWMWIAGTLAAIAIVGAAFSFLPLQDWADALESRISRLGRAGYLLFFVAFVVVTLLPLPGWMFVVAAGAMFGMAWGFALVWTGTIAGATLAFLLTRHLFRDSLKKRLARKPAFAAVDKALRKEGWHVVALLRLTPVPFQNYLLGLTKVKLRNFALGTAIGKIPSDLVYLGLGATGRAVLGLPAAYKWGLIAVGIIAGVIALRLIARAAGRRLGFAP